MSHLKTGVLAVVFAVAAGSAFAADDAMMKSDSMKMSHHDQMMMKSCQSMSHDMMMKNRGCMKMMKMHPDMMKSDGMMSH